MHFCIMNPSQSIYPTINAIQFVSYLLFPINFKSDSIQPFSTSFEPHSHYLAFRLYS